MTEEGRHVRTKTAIALKIIDLEGIKERELAQPAARDSGYRFIDPPHPNCVGLRHIDGGALPGKESSSEKEVILLVLELAQGGELFDFLMHTGQSPRVASNPDFRS